MSEKNTNGTAVTALESEIFGSAASPGSIHEIPAGSMLAPINPDIPFQFPDKQGRRSQRAEIMDMLIARHGYVGAYVLVKYIEKLVAEDKEGLVHHLKAGAESELEERYGGKAEIAGAKVSISSGRGWYEYPEEVTALEQKKKALEAEIAEMKKSCELDGTATKYKGKAQLTVRF